MMSTPLSGFLETEASLDQELLQGVGEIHLRHLDLDHSLRIQLQQELFPFIHDIDSHLFFEAIYFTVAELLIWICLQYVVELCLRRKECRYMLQ